MHKITGGVINHEDFGKIGPSRPYQPTMTDEESQEWDRIVRNALVEQTKRENQEATRQELAVFLRQILHRELTEETDKAFGTESARASHQKEFLQYQNWCKENEVAPLPAMAEAVASYAIEKQLSPSRLNKVLAAIKVVSDFAEMPFQHDHTFIRALTRWIKRRYEEAQDGPPMPAEQSKSNGIGKAH